MMKEPGLEDKLKEPTVDDALRQKMFYDEPVSKRIPDQRCKSLPMCLFWHWVGLTLFFFHLIFSKIT